MSAWRHAGTSTRPASSLGGLSSGVSSSQKPSARALLLAHPLGARDLEQRLRELIRVAHVELEPAPGTRLRAHLGEREPLEARLDRQQQQRCRLVAAPAELDRAHRRAAGRRREDAAAGVGEEDRVDQLRLAARELGDERDDELLVAEPLAQRADLLRGLAVRQVVLGKEACQVLEAFAQRCAPPAEGRRDWWRKMASSGGRAGFGPW
jgi:hypothetical protein